MVRGQLLFQFCQIAVVNVKAKPAACEEITMFSPPLDGFKSASYRHGWPLV
jgi:hypothetical protein